MALQLNSMVRGVVRAFHQPARTRWPLLLLTSFATFHAALAAADEADGAAQLEPMTVEASPLGHTADELVQPVTVLGGEELNRKRRNTIGETLEQEPGVATTDFGAGAGRPVIRGQAGPRLQVLENGISSSDASDVSTDHAVSIDPSHAQQIEVLKGPATLLYGSGASGGVVNVIDGRLPVDVTEGLHGNFESHYGTNGDERAVSTDVGYGIGDHQFHADYTGRRTLDYSIHGNANVDGISGSQGTQKNSGAQLNAGSLSYGYISDGSSVAFSVSKFNTLYGLPVEPEAFIDLHQTRYDVQGILNKPFAWVESLKLRAGYTDYAHAEYEDPVTLGTTFTNKQHQERIEAVHIPLADWRGVVGLQFNHRDFSALGAEAFLPQVTSQQISLFIIEERPFSLGKFELGARIGRDTNRPQALKGRPNPHRDFTPISLSAGTVFDLPRDMHLKLSVTHAERSAVPEELYAFGPHGATKTFERGDSTLAMESANNLELGLDYHGERLSWQGNLYYQLVRNYVYLGTVDQGLNADGTDPGGAAPDGVADRVDDGGNFTGAAGDPLLLSYRQGTARFYGIEGEVAYQLLQGPVTLSTRLFGDAVRGELTAGENLPRITPARIGLGLDSGYGPLAANVDFTRVQSQDQLAPLETTTAGFNLLSTTLAYRFRLGSSAPDNSEFFIRGRNLLDVEARRHTSFIKDAATTPGRSVLMGFKLAF